MKYQFLHDTEAFSIHNPENYSYLYFPLASETGYKASITPQLGGDAKIDQNTFLLEPVSAENLHNNRSTRNFWCHFGEGEDYAVAGNSAEQIGNKFTKQQDESQLEAGFMWHTLTRISKKYTITSQVTNFTPVDQNIEIMVVTLENTGTKQVTMIPTAAIPIYGRSADNIRDHRHVTSLLHRIQTTKYGVEVTPTLSFDERGHQQNHTTYFVNGFTAKGEAPECFYPTVDMFLGEGGNFERPYSVITEQKGITANTQLQGREAVGAMRFQEITLQPGEKSSYIIVMGCTQNRQDIDYINQNYHTEQQVQESLEKTKQYWEKQVNVSFHTKDKTFDQYMKWVSFQPILRRIFGCSFLPHHDYGKGGRGWRDLWQDCLALLLMEPGNVREMLLNHFKGVRVDGTNATIIGDKPGEFVADRNNITRVWMDHGVWPCITTNLYLQQTGDYAILLEKIPYFKDQQANRGTEKDTDWNGESTWQQDEKKQIYEGTVLEHLLIQNLTACLEVGKHNQIRLRGADWNDAIDMAGELGESVAFTNAYAANLDLIADMLCQLQKKHGIKNMQIMTELQQLLTTQQQEFLNISYKLDTLSIYCHKCIHTVLGEQATLDLNLTINQLRQYAEWMREQIREQEWVSDGATNHWFNGYYDNHGNQVEGMHADKPRMMLTSQVFSIMAGTASDEQVATIVKSADIYLYQKNMGGYRLNTDFQELKLDMGRMFGFSYGDKENGAVFSHMTVMFANALYQRGFAKEGYKALKTLEEQAMHFEVSKIYPGVPEYFDASGRGMYHYLTGAASWYMLTVITQMFGVRGQHGDLLLSPQLLEEQFDEEGKASVTIFFAGKQIRVTYHNPDKKEAGEYHIVEAACKNTSLPVEAGMTSMSISKDFIQRLDASELHEISVTLR